MAKDPAFLFYSSDFITGVSFLSMEERGQYITALCLLHQHGGYISKEDIEIAVGKLSKRVMTKFITDKDNIIHNKRLLNETIKRSAFCESRRKARMSHIRGTHVKRMENENENENRDVNKDNIKEGSVDKPAFLDTLKINPAYKHINFDIEIGKMQAWLSLPRNKGRKLTDRFILNWINKVDKPIIIDKPKPIIDLGYKGLSHDPKVLEMIKATTQKMKG